MINSEVDSALFRFGKSTLEFLLGRVGKVFLQSGGKLNKTIGKVPFYTKLPTKVLLLIVL